MRAILLVTMLLAFLNLAKAQVKTNFNNPETITTRGKLGKDFRAKSLYVIPARDIKALLEKEMLENKSGEAKPFRIAEAIKVDIDVIKEAVWLKITNLLTENFLLWPQGQSPLASISTNSNFQRDQSYMCIVRMEK